MKFCTHVHEHVVKLFYQVYTCLVTNLALIYIATHFPRFIDSLKWRFSKHQCYSHWYCNYVKAKLVTRQLWFEWSMYFCTRYIKWNLSAILVHTEASNITWVMHVFWPELNGIYIICNYTNWKETLSFNWCKLEVTKLIMLKLWLIKYQWVSRNLVKIDILLVLTLKPYNT